MGTVKNRNKQRFNTFTINTPIRRRRPVTPYMNFTTRGFWGPLVIRATHGTMNNSSNSLNLKERNPLPGRRRATLPRGSVVLNDSKQRVWNTLPNTINRRHRVRNRQRTVSRQPKKWGHQRDQREAEDTDSSKGLSELAQFFLRVATKYPR